MVVKEERDKERGRKGKKEREEERNLDKENRDFSWEE